MAISTEEMRARREAEQDGDTKIGQAVQEVTQRAEILIREEIELAKAEMTEKLTTIAKGAAVGAAGGLFVVIGIVILLEGFAWLAYFELPGIPNQSFFWGFFLVAAVLFLLGALAGYLASRAFKRGAPPTPELAIDEAKRIRDTVKSEHPETTI
jgi:H+/Cl- antiporter ClcA